MKIESSYKYKFSVIMAVYNVESFLEEAIESVINQDIGFREHVQLILVDDGSTDGSGKICDAYGQKYPRNIVVIHKENGGVSQARNKGFEHVEGEYVNCLDSDDKLSANTFSSVYHAFEKWKNEVDLITIPLNFFEGKTGGHILNNKFENGSRVIDLNEEHDKPLLSMSCSFVKSSVVSKYSFDERLAYAEDAKVVVQILQEKMKYGVVAEACYWYRKRTSGGASAIQSSLNNKKWYLDYMKYFSWWSAQNSRFKAGDHVPEFVQYTLMYDLQWRINSEQPPAQVMNEEECAEYYELLRKVLNCIDDSIILQQKQMTVPYKLYALQLKYGEKPWKKEISGDIEYCFGGSASVFESDFDVKIEFIKMNAQGMEIEGTMTFPAEHSKDCVQIYVSSNDRLYECEEVKRNLVKVSMGQIIAYTKGFRVRIPLKPGSEQKISFGCKIEGHAVEKKQLKFGKFSPLQNRMWNSYYAVRPYILTYQKHVLYVRPYSVMKHIYREISFIKALIKKKSRPAYKAAVMRTLAHFYHLFPHKEKWVISDRINKADDNGEAFFDYLNRIKPKNIRYYFAVSKDSPDYERIKKSGRVIAFLGWKYKWFCLCGAKFISSQGENYVYRPFRESSYFYADFMQKTRYIFLQHGVTKDDISQWMERYEKNVHLFVTTTVPEYNSIINGNYGYDAKVVKMTGFPRYDRLYHNEKKYITIMPSWRAYLVGETNIHTGKRMPAEHFADSRYCKMYSELLTNEELISTANEQGYTIRFMSHPNMSECIPFFHMDQRVELADGETTAYRDIFAETDLLITDYSSVAFDFAYLRKPVLYFQADKEEFFSGRHSYEKGYFEYEKDGFGEVVYETGTLIDLVKDYISKDCALKEMYAERIDATFPYSDKNNSKRVYENICKIN